MTLEENKAVVRRQFDLIQQEDFDALDELHTPDFANHALGRIQIGLEAFKAVLRGIHSTSPDETTTIEDMMSLSARP